jgi:hypothetical protein
LVAGVVAVEVKVLDVVAVKVLDVVAVKVIVAVKD